VYDPVNRITSKEILKHPYFNDLDKRVLPAGDYDGKLILPPLPTEAAVAAH
jgi:hypothetical protein